MFVTFQDPAALVSGKHENGHNYGDGNGCGLDMETDIGTDTGSGMDSGSDMDTDTDTMDISGEGDIQRFGRWVADICKCLIQYHT
jgi:hypothetical protein